MTWREKLVLRVLLMVAIWASWGEGVNAGLTNEVRELLRDIKSGKLDATEMVDPNA